MIYVFQISRRFLRTILKTIKSIDVVKNLEKIYWEIFVKCFANSSCTNDIDLSIFKVKRFCIEWLRKTVISEC